MRVPTHPGRLLKRELAARKLSANRLAIALGVPSGRIVEILNAKRGITPDTALRLGFYFGNGARFWLDMQTQHDLGALEAAHGREIVQQVHRRRPPRRDGRKAKRGRRRSRSHLPNTALRFTASRTGSCGAP